MPSPCCQGQGREAAALTRSDWVARVCQAAARNERGGNNSSWQDEEFIVPQPRQVTSSLALPVLRCKYRVASEEILFSPRRHAPNSGRQAHLQIGTRVRVQQQPEALLEALSTQSRAATSESIRGPSNETQGNDPSPPNNSAFPCPLFWGGHMKSIHVFTVHAEKYPTKNETGASLSRLSRMFAVGSGPPTESDTMFAHLSVG